MVTVTELLDRLDVVRSLNGATGPIKARNRGFGVGELLVGIAAAQLAGQDFLVGLDRVRADTAGQLLAPVPGLASTTAAGLARRCTDEHWRGVETGLAAVHERMLTLLPPRRADALCEAGATIDLDTTDVEVYGRKKERVDYNYQGQRAGRPHVAIWAETETPLAADLGGGLDDPRATADALLDRALTGLPPRIQPETVRLRADAGYFAGRLARAAHTAGVGYAIGAKRLAPLWRLLDGIDESCWVDAKDMHDTQVAVADYRPADWPDGTRLLIRRVRLSPEQISTDARSRRRRTLHPDQRALPFDEIAELDAIYGYSFIATNLDVSTSEHAVEVEHWYRHRTTVENVFRDSKDGAALRHLPSGYHAVNTAWMWGALLAAATAGWLHQLTAERSDDDTRIIAGHGVDGGKAMIATLRRRLVAVPGRVVRHARGLTLRLPPGHHLVGEILARTRTLPAPG